MVVTVVLTYGVERVASTIGQDFVENFNIVKQEVAKLGLPHGTYDLHDQFGRIDSPEDLRRAVGIATKEDGAGECAIEVREHLHHAQIRELSEAKAGLHLRCAKMESSIHKAEERVTKKLEAVKSQLTALLEGFERKLQEEVTPALQELSRDRHSTRLEQRRLEEKVSAMDVERIAALVAEAAKGRHEVVQAVDRVSQFETEYGRERAEVREASRRSAEELKELQMYLLGKLDVCIEADADLRRDQQVLLERAQIIANDLGLLTQEHRQLARQCAGALEESEDLRALMGQVQEDNDHLRFEWGQVRSELSSVHRGGGAGTDPLSRLDGVLQHDGTLYFRHWHKDAKANDVQLSPDLQVATGRGFLAATGVVIGNDEGLVVADGPCRRLGTPGQFSSYYELKMDEVSAAKEGAGGLFVGMSLSGAEAILAHPRREFDGWLLGGDARALVCSAGTAGLGEEEASKLLPAAAEGLLGPRRPTGEVREVISMWSSQSLRKGDRVGVLLRCQRDGGAKLRVVVNGRVVATQDFVEGPPAAAVGLLTPVVRLAGTGKSARLLPGLQPPTHVLAD